MIIKNSNTRRNIFENRYAIFMIIFAIILVLLIIQTMKRLVKENISTEENRNEISNNIVDYKSQQTVISGTNVTSSQHKTNTTIINSFFEYCNNNQISQAYSLLSEDCKSEVFGNNIQNFKSKYVDKIFTCKRNYSIQPWINSYCTTYRVTISEDILSTGKVSSLENTIEDYYTVIPKDGETRLSINGYIGKEDIQTKNQSQQIQIEVTKKEIYKEYEIYEIKVANNTKNTILLDTRKDTKSVYLKDENNKKYQAYMYEIMDTKLIIRPNEEKTIDIPFNKMYSNKAKIQQMVFEDIILNYDAYENGQQYVKHSESINIK